MIDAHFQTLTTFPQRNFQRETITKLLHRQDILLRAPTGSGKTETAIAKHSVGIARSWQGMTRFLNQSLPLTQANLSKSIYPIKKEFDLNQLNTADEFEYFHLYLLVVRALRLCDQRSVQL